MCWRGLGSTESGIGRCTCSARLQQYRAVVAMPDTWIHCRPSSWRTLRIVRNVQHLHLDLARLDNGFLPYQILDSMSMCQCKSWTELQISCWENARRFTATRDRRLTSQRRATMVGRSSGLQDIYSRVGRHQNKVLKALDLSLPHLKSLLRAARQLKHLLPPRHHPAARTSTLV